MKPLTEKRHVSPALLAAERRRRATAAERANTALAGLLDELPADRELVVETLRAVIRGASAKAAALVGSPRAIGLLSGAAADVAPAFENQPKLSAADALFRRREGDS